MKSISPRIIRGALVCLGLLLTASLQAASLKTKNVVLIISDGLRWQEVFGGADPVLMNKANGGVADTNALGKEFWRDTPMARREALLPFFWNEIAQHGQLFGNQSKGSVVAVTNGKKFSYPGYNEIITGAGDPRINSNDKIPNANITVFEWLNRDSQFRNRVAIVGSWDAFPYIFNIGRSQLPIWPAWDAAFAKNEIATPMTDLLRDTFTPWSSMTYDSFVFQVALEQLKRKKPRVLFLGFGETDEWAHEARYDRYLEAAHHVDDFIRRLWQTAQSIPQYRDKTTFIITADHGRGSGPSDWKSHGAAVAGAESDWIAVIGPDTPPLGERTNIEKRTQNQIAATIAALLGEDYRASFPEAGPVIEDVVRLRND